MHDNDLKNLFSNSLAVQGRKGSPGLPGLTGFKGVAVSYQIGRGCRQGKNGINSPFFLKNWHNTLSMTGHV